MVRRNYKKELVFADHPEFRPNLTPREIFELGSFGGTYWRPIKSKITGKNHKNVHKKYSQLHGVSDDILTLPWNEYDKSKNKYNVKVGTTLEYWEKKGWITKHHPYGWVHWYCDFYSGKRGPDDERQIGRWLRFAGPKGRFRLRLANMIRKNSKQSIRKKLNDYSISPAIRQSLQHWAYKISSHDIS